MSKRVSAIENAPGGDAWVMDEGWDIDLSAAEYATLRANGTVKIDGETFVDFDIDLAEGDTDEFDRWRKTL